MFIERMFSKIIINKANKAGRAHLNLPKGRIMIRYIVVFSKFRFK